MNRCVICGEETKKPVLALLYHFRLVDFDMLPYFRGNLKGFGLFVAIRNSSPILAIYNEWKHKNKKLTFEDGSKLDDNG